MPDTIARRIPLLIFDLEKAQDMPEIEKNMKSTIG